MVQSRSLTASSALHIARDIDGRVAARHFQICSSASSSVRTFASLLGSVMRADLMRRIVILSSSSPGETGTLISFMGGILAKFDGRRR